MTQSCPSCGTVAAPEARFCRRCGTLLLRAVSTQDGDEQVSPLAATVPLSDEGRTTSGLASNDPSHSPDTNRVNRAELDALLRPSKPETDFDASPSYKARNPPDASNATGTSGASGDAEQATINAPAQTPPAPPDSGSITRPSLHLFAQAMPHLARDDSRDAERPAAPAFDDDEELTITVARPAAPKQVVPLNADDFAPRYDNGDAATRAANVAPSNVARTDAADSNAARNSNVASSNIAAHSNVVSSSAAPSVAAAQQGNRPRATRGHRAWYAVAGVSVFLLLATLAAFWLGVGPFRRTSSVETTNGAPAPTPDAKQLAEEKLAGAESLLAAGNLDAAIALLREATALDAANTPARRRLAALLLDNGQRREAIAEYRAILRYDARDTEAWRALARAQLDESLYAEAAESYRQLVALAGVGNLNDNELLAYAESLRLSGRARDAQEFYRRLAASPVADVANAARQHLSEFASLAPTPSASPDPARDERDALNQNRAVQTPQSVAQSSPTLAPQPTPAIVVNAPPTAPPARTENLSGGEHFKRGEQLWSSNRAAALSEFRAATGKGNRDAYYYLGLAVIEGKDPRTLHPALLGAAYQYFQNAMRSGKFRSEARRYEQLLGDEVDRRRQQRQ